MIKMINKNSLKKHKHIQAIQANKKIRIIFKIFEIRRGTEDDLRIF